MQLADAVKNDASTRFLQQRYVIAAVRERCAHRMKGGVRQFAHIKPDRFIEIQASIGVLASEDFMAQIAELLRSQLTANGFVRALRRQRLAGPARARHRPRRRDLGRECRQARERVHRSPSRTRPLSATVTVGLGLLPPTNPDVGAAITDAISATRRGRELGGNQMYVVDKSDTDTRVQAYDKIWVKHIKSALMENRFRLVQQPIASLLGEDKGMFDVLVRMLDEQGTEVLPCGIHRRRRAQ